MLLVQVRWRRMKARKPVGLLVLALRTLVLLLLLMEVLAHVPMLLWVRTFALFWVLAPLMLVKEVQVQVLVRVLEVLVKTLVVSVLTGGGSVNLRGLMNSMTKSGISTARR